MVMPTGWTPCQDAAATTSLEEEAHGSHAAADRAAMLAARDAVARQCLQYRGVLPAAAGEDASGDKDGKLLAAALAEAHARGLTRPGDRVVVSQCPRKSQPFQSVFAECGVVKIVTIGADGVSTRVAAAVLDSAGHVIGSREEDESDLV
jgi:hypothetical protein